MKDIIVETASGKLRGDQEKGVYAFKGIPYGGHVCGKNRFKPAAANEPWTGIKDAVEYGPNAWQPNMFPVVTRMGGNTGMDSVSEDCLVLNVWTQGLNDGKKRPVMVWLHGGGFYFGSADFSPVYHGASLAKKSDVVMVSINHRLGVFGYLYLKDIVPGEEYADSGNVGMLDLVLALKWVRENIAAFGGDPDNVTIFGHSGGGSKVTNLMAMPAAKGLFHKAIVLSGPGVRAQTPEAGTLLAQGTLKVLGVKPNQIKELLDMKASMIFSASELVAPRGGMAPGLISPVADGRTLPAHPFDPVAPAYSNDVPLMIGSTRDETSIMLMYDPMFGKFDEDALHKKLYDMLQWRVGAMLPQARSEDLIKAYKRTRPHASPHELLIAISSDMIRIGSVWIAERKSAVRKAPVYMYYVKIESPACNGLLKSFHGVDLPYVFNNIEPTELSGSSPDRAVLADQMSSAWVAFARSGNPNNKYIPNWTPYSKENRATMIFNVESHIEIDPNSEERLAWN